MVVQVIISRQRELIEKVTRLTATINEMDNPFEEETAELLTLDTTSVLPSASIKLLTCHYEIGWFILESL